METMRNTQSYNMKKMRFILQFSLVITVLMACSQKNANASNEGQPSGHEPQTLVGEAAAPAATIDGIGQFVSWDMGAMSVTKEDNLFVVSDATGNLKLYLKPLGNGTYQEVSTTHDMIGQGARFVAEKVGDVTTLTAYSDEMILFSLLSCDDLKSYRNKAYRRLLTSRFKPTADGPVTITDEKMSGPILPDSPELSYFFIEDGKGDLTDKIRLSPGRFHLAYSPAEKGVNLHYCLLNPQTGDLDVDYSSENTLILRYADDPGWPWLSTDVLDAGFLIYNLDKHFWWVMLEKLKAVSQPNAVVQWNRRLVENLIEYNEPFTGLESSE